MQDVGRALNPRAIGGQIQGGVVQGPATRCTRRSPSGGTAKSGGTGWETYSVPLAQDVVLVTIDLIEGAPSIGPLGTKGAGEVSIFNVAAAVGCAVPNANGRPVSETPLTRPGSSGCCSAARDP